MFAIKVVTEFMGYVPKRDTWLVAGGQETEYLYERIEFKTREEAEAYKNTFPSHRRLVVVEV